MPETMLTPPVVDQATIDHYVAKGRRERSRALAAMIRSLFSAPEPKIVDQGECAA